MFTFVHYRPTAWIAVGLLLAAILAGLSWLLRNGHTAREHAGAGWQFPPQLARLHGLAATLTIVLAVLSALTASRG
jgi:hypothetical protein